MSTTTKAAAAAPAATAEPATSNRLPVLAAEIKAFHQSAQANLRASVENGIACGLRLIEAKTQLDHGQWLPWLDEHCAISERTAQLYIRLAKNRTTIEAQIRNGVADLTMNEAAALLMMGSDLKKLLAFVKDCEGLSGDELIEFCIAEGVGVISTAGYDPFFGKSETEQIEWLLFALYLSYDSGARRGYYEPKYACYHVEWVIQRPFQNVAEWLGPEGGKFRKRYGFREPELSEQFQAHWAAFLAANSHRKAADITQEIDALQRRAEQEISAGKWHKPKRRRAAAPPDAAAGPPPEPAPAADAASSDQGRAGL